MSKSIIRPLAIVFVLANVALMVAACTTTPGTPATATTPAVAPVTKFDASKAVYYLRAVGCPVLLAEAANLQPTLDAKGQVVLQVGTLGLTTACSIGTSVPPAAISAS